MQTDQEKRTILAIGLSLLVYMVWVQWFMPPMAPAPMVTDTTGLEAPAEPAMDSAQVGSTEAALLADGDGAATSAGAAQPTVAEEPAIPDHWVDITNDHLTARVTSREGSFRSVDLMHYSSQRKVQPIWNWLMDKVTGEEEVTGWVAYGEGGEPEHLVSDRGSFVLAGMGPVGPDTEYQVVENDGYIVATSRARNGVRVIKTYRISAEPHVLDVTVRFENESGQAVRDLWVGVADEMSGSSGRFENTVRPIAYVDEGIERLDDLDDVEGSEQVRHRAQAGWLGIGNKYFMSVLAPEEGTDGEVLFDDLGDGRTGAFFVSTTALDAGASRELRFLAYMGPKDLDLVEGHGHSLDKAIEFGWFGFFARLLLGLLKTFYSLAGNWGVAIVMLTVMVKIVFFPLMQKQFVSSKRMQAIQPELKALKEKYKDNKDLQTKETMRLFQENKVNPMSGCLPMIIQMPVWFALYNVMLFSVELYGTEFLYLKDLTEVDPYGVLPLLVSVLMVVQQKMMPMGSMDPMQQKMMRLMPVMFGIFMFSFPSGLVLYFCINNSLTILQQWVIYRKKDVDVPAPASG